MEYLSSPLQLLEPCNYYELPVISNSKLNLLLKEIRGEDTKFNVSRETLRKGQLTHLAIYEPDAFATCPEFVEYMHPDGRQANKRMIDECVLLALTAKKSPTISFFLNHKQAIFEEEVFCLLNEVPVKMKIDCRVPGIGINDAKTTSAKTRNEFISKFDEFGYWRQAAMYLMGTGETEFIFSGISKAKAGLMFTVNVNEYPEQLAQAKSDVLGLLEEYVKLNPKYVDRARALFKL